MTTQRSKSILELKADEAKTHLLKGASYFSVDMPHYINFEPVLDAVSVILNDGDYKGFQKGKFRPSLFSDVNYRFDTNKDGKFEWRPFEIIHPAIYVALVNLLCQQDNWDKIQSRFRKFQSGIVDCCSVPVVSMDAESDQATQIKTWWHEVEQRSLAYSLEFSHLLHTDVTDCYGSLYTHSIGWALHGLENSKQSRNKGRRLGDQIDFFIRESRYGQTNGIPQGSVLMDFIAEMVLGYVDELIDDEIGDWLDVRILRYRDDYRIFANSDERAEAVFKVISDKLRGVGMRLGPGKTYLSKNIVEGSVKSDKLAAIGLQDLGTTNAKTIQKQLLRLHSFGQRYPNSGALRRLLSDFHKKIVKEKTRPEDLLVQVAIATDIAFVSPGTFPAVAGILSHLISRAASTDEKRDLWEKVLKKMKRVPYNGYLEIWLQRVTKPKSVGLSFDSEESICKTVDGKSANLWNNEWISSSKLKEAMDVKNIVVGDPVESDERISPREIQLFNVRSF